MEWLRISTATLERVKNRWLVFVRKLLGYSIRKRGLVHPFTELEAEVERLRRYNVWLALLSGTQIVPRWYWVSLYIDSKRSYGYSRSSIMQC